MGNVIIHTIISIYGDSHHSHLTPDDNVLSAKIFQSFLFSLSAIMLVFQDASNYSRYVKHIGLILFICNTIREIVMDVFMGPIYNAVEVRMMMSGVIVIDRQS